MCGIMGVVGQSDASAALKSFENMAKILERRGHDAFGFAALDFDSNQLLYGKLSLPYSKAVRSSDYADFTSFVKRSVKPDLIMGHTRLATHGGVEDSANNQPVTLKDWIIVHNGIITNDELVKKDLAAEVKDTELDTYAALGLLDSLTGSSSTFDISLIMKSVHAKLSGANNFAIHSVSRGLTILYSSNGSLYLKEKDGKWYFSSENRALLNVDAEEARQILFPNIFIYDHAKSSGKVINVEQESEQLSPAIKKENNFYPHLISKKTSAVYASTVNISELNKVLVAEYEKVFSQTKGINRCSKCLLPANFPGLFFDLNGICNICLSYKSARPQLTKDDLYNRLTDNGRKDKVLVSLSGGRDSCFTLHNIVKEFGLKASAFTYDWGMVTDLARRNQSRMCGELGVEHLIVSADIGQKRKYIKDNVSAWLSRPSLGTIPLFMAGDKHYFYYAEKVKKENNLHINVMGENKLEKTGFKTKFAGAEQSGENSSMAYSMSSSNKMKMLWYYGKEFALNTGYWNTSLLDTFTGYLSYYVMPRSYLNLFDYIEWREDSVNSVLAKYDWEYSPDCATSWRIGDGTAPFYNFIYYVMTGFSENDTLRANQIREGHITNQEARELIERDNHPRAESFAWYCEAIGLDPIAVAKKICEAPKQYQV